MNDSLVIDNFVFSEDHFYIYAEKLSPFLHWVFEKGKCLGGLHILALLQKFYIVFLVISSDYLWGLESAKNPSFLLIVPK